MKVLLIVLVAVTVVWLYRRISLFFKEMSAEVFKYLDVYLQFNFTWFRGKRKESEVAQSCPTLCDPMDCSLPGSFVNGIFQARVPEWVAISFSRGSSRPRNWTWVSRIVDRCFTIWATREVQQNKGRLKKEGNSNTSYDTDKPWGHYAKWNEPVTKAQTLNDFPYMRYHSSYSNSH